MCNNVQIYKAFDSELSEMFFVDAFNNVNTSAIANKERWQYMPCKKRTLESYETRAYDILTIKTFIYEVSYDIKYHKYMIQNIIKIGE